MTTLFHADRCDLEFKTHLFATADFFKWLETKNLHLEHKFLPPVNSLKGYRFLHVEAILHSIEFMTGNYDDEHASAVIAASPRLKKRNQCFYCHDEARYLFAGAVLATEAARQWRELFRQAVATSELTLLDYSSKLPVVPGMDFFSLSSRLEEWFDEPLESLPENLREQIRRDFVPLEWNELAPEQRHSIATQVDNQHNPKALAEFNKSFELNCQIIKVEREIRELELLSALTPLERESKRRQLDELKTELGGLYGKRRELTKSPLLDGASKLPTVTDCLESGTRGGNIFPNLQSETTPAPFKQKLLRQEEEILNWLERSGHDLKNLPPHDSGKAGIKADVWKALEQNKALFTSDTTFNKAWQRALKNEKMQYKE